VEVQWVSLRKLIVMSGLAVVSGLVVVSLRKLIVMSGQARSPQVIGPGVKAFAALR